MNQKQYVIPKSYFQHSLYADKLSSELDSAAEGLLFDRFVHDVGADLHLDVLYDKSSLNGDCWFLGGDQHIKMFLEEQDDEHYQLILTPLSQEGITLIEQAEKSSLKEIINKSG
ncbi:hypothetical protein ACFSCX_02205 [Bacillus salitolerans]|uniref:Uncharacterized protein n=1 Tax=Bacillus salitolerans TaxID=1437434 RepID=A0ABW4LKS9_9BACI